MTDFPNRIPSNLPNARLCPPCASGSHGDYCLGVIDVDTVIDVETNFIELTRYECECECLPYEQEIDRMAGSIAAGFE